MTLSFRKLTSLSHDEIQFIFCMMRQYGGMPEPGTEKKTNSKGRRGRNGRRNGTPKIQVNMDTTKPNLFDFTDPKWEICEDEKFLTYREIMEGTHI